MSYKPDFVPNLINAEPAAFLGLSLPEVVRIASTRVFYSVVGFVTFVSLLYPHIFTILLAVVFGVAFGMFLTKKKATKVLIECRGKDPFYSSHKDEVEFEKLQSRLNKFGIKLGKKRRHSFLVEDGNWSQR